MRNVIKWSFVLLIPAIAMGIYGGTHTQWANASANQWFALLGWGLALTPFVLLGLVVFFHIDRAFSREIKVAFSDIPTPAQVSVQLEQEWGREPTMQEVQAVLEMLTSRRNQALINAGMGFGAAYLIGHNGKL